MMHVDDYLDSGQAHPLAKEFLEHARRPAVEKDHRWLAANRLYVMWQGRKYWCVGASRMGDVWLKDTAGGRPNAFYDHRVDITELSDWHAPTDSRYATLIQKTPSNPGERT